MIVTQHPPLSRPESNTPEQIPQIIPIISTPTNANYPLPKLDQNFQPSSPNARNSMMQTQTYQQLQTIKISNKIRQKLRKDTVIEKLNDIQNNVLNNNMLSKPTIYINGKNQQYNRSNSTSRVNSQFSRVSYLTVDGQSRRLSPPTNVYHQPLHKIPPPASTNTQYMLYQSNQPFSTQPRHLQPPSNTSKMREIHSSISENKNLTKFSQSELIHNLELQSPTHAQICLVPSPKNSTQIYHQIQQNNIPNIKIIPVHNRQQPKITWQPSHSPPNTTITIPSQSNQQIPEMISSNVHLLYSRQSEPIYQQNSVPSLKGIYFNKQPINSKIDNIDFNKQHQIENCLSERNSKVSEQIKQNKQSRKLNKSKSGISISLLKQQNKQTQLQKIQLVNTHKIQPIVMKKKQNNPTQQPQLQSNITQQNKKLQKQTKTPQPTIQNSNENNSHLHQPHSPTSKYPILQPQNSPNKNSKQKLTITQSLLSKDKPQIATPPLNCQNNLIPQPISIISNTVHKQTYQSQKNPTTSLSQLLKNQPIQVTQSQSVNFHNLGRKQNHTNGQESQNRGTYQSHITENQHLKQTTKPHNKPYTIQQSNTSENITTIKFQQQLQTINNENMNNYKNLFYQSIPIPSSYGYFDEQKSNQYKVNQQTQHDDGGNGNSHVQVNGYLKIQNNNNNINNSHSNGSSYINSNTNSNNNSNSNWYSNNNSNSNWYSHNNSSSNSYNYANNMYNQINGNPYQNVHASISPVVSSSCSQSNNISNISSSNYNSNNNNNNHTDNDSINHQPSNITNSVPHRYINLPKQNFSAIIQQSHECSSSSLVASTLLIKQNSANRQNTSLIDSQNLRNREGNKINISNSNVNSQNNSNEKTSHPFVMIGRQQNKEHQQIKLSRNTNIKKLQSIAELQLNSNLNHPHSILSPRKNTNNLEQIMVNNNNVYFIKNPPSTYHTNTKISNKTNEYLQNEKYTQNIQKSTNDIIRNSKTHLNETNNYRYRQTSNQHKTDKIHETQISNQQQDNSSYGHTYRENKGEDSKNYQTTFDVYEMIDDIFNRQLKNGLSKIRDTYGKAMLNI